MAVWIMEKKEGYKLKFNIKESEVRSAWER
ncbi:MAG: hypothetical protein FD156_2198 [Nitrospirae bacterium]|nr:MAG: hypothetical protein FD156_2198 [Nitrospirota bacterium]